MTPPTSAHKPPKPRIPARAKGAIKDSSKTNAPDKPAGRVTTAELASRLERVAGSVERMERLLTPSRGSSEVAAEEQALLNLVEAIVDRRTEQALVPLARLATLVERLATADNNERTDLSRETLEQLSLVLEALGIDKVSPAQGSEINPLLHQEVEERSDTELEEGLIVSVVRPGFRVRGGRLLIPALVAVSGGRHR